MQIIRIKETDSTNTWVGRHESELPAEALAYCLTQTAGRGQRGNSWESEPGKNITASLILHPRNFPASSQFLISEAVALALVEFLEKKGVEAKVKWPNDIYVGEKKICGILVEHVITGRNISRTIAGFGLNLNQEKFMSDAPNPVSLKMLTGISYSLEDSVAEIAQLLQKAIGGLCAIEEENQADENSVFRKIAKSHSELHARFMQKLWRNDGKIYKFHDHKCNEPIQAAISNVDTDGTLTLKLHDGERRSYLFKEIEFILR